MTATAKPKKRQLPARMVSAKGVAFVASWEGFVPRPYNDAAKPPNATIGYGHLMHPGPVTQAEKNKTITRAQGLALLRQDLLRAVRAVNGLGLRLTQNEFDALVSFAYNCGPGALTGGIARELHAGDKQAAMRVLEEYVHAGPIVLTGLVRRRAAEAHLFLAGIY